MRYRAYRTSLWLLCLLVPMLADARIAGCPPSGFDLPKLRALKQAHFVIDDAATRASLARGLLACLRDPDPELRDRIGYEAYAAWREGNALDAATWKFIEARLKAELARDRPDPDGVAKPFAALILSEAVNADRTSPFLDAAARHALLAAATSYMTTLRDYRGFDDTVGWRHGVAHAADLLAQLALEPDFGRPELDEILRALASQVVAAEARFYVYGESERLAEAVAAVALRGVYSESDWQRWLHNVADPAPLASWDDAYWSQAGLAKRHDTMAFLLALHADAAHDKRTQLSQLAPIVATAMQRLR
ncbi:DUF2785 domain-containing protein [Dokdonella soli]|uniref:DUF2785 domain-containing protein n=1 Tax=Dokdonella soli TaxID=529810 RepID=A0ABP3TMJ6_9GAMM